ncbi:pyridoxine/pyridoxamine 5'-phosphate oxidase-like [Culicoides brevitarsis]|uniref:pyridoxine/pyridoxamine 5'-phosphate oxidase-like n=1 Tax=Culicoides brevitarsis TaxID=469753 RepID=UPI00307BD154
MRISLFRRMSVDIASLRLKYKTPKEVFTEESIVKKEPFSLFNQWFQDALNTPEILEPNAIALGTVNKEGFPSLRYVLLKDYSPAGFTFFTNYGSRKAQEIQDNPNVAMTIYWTPLRRSIRIEGVASKIPREESEKYFHSRPRASQIGALASPQSTAIPSRQYLDDIESEIKAKLGEDGEVPLPNWGGYLVVPRTIEFWQGQTNRLHDRIRFKKFDGDVSALDAKVTHVGEDGWIYERLAP